MIIDGLQVVRRVVKARRSGNKRARAPANSYGTDNVVVDEAMTVLPLGHDGMGWWAKRGYVPPRCLDDAAKTGVRSSIAVNGLQCQAIAPGTCKRHPSARARFGDDQFRRRRSSRMEHALKHHPAVYDAVVAGRRANAGQRW
jgi:hypothetical protein